MKKLLFITLALLPCLGFAQKTISAKAAMDIITGKENLQIVDVRTPAEFDSSAIQNAINIDYKNQNFKENILSVDKKKPILIYCRSGKRSYYAMIAMMQLGYTEVYNLQGGILAFKKEYPDLVLNKMK